MSLEKRGGGMIILPVILQHTVVSMKRKKKPGCSSKSFISRVYQVTCVCVRNSLVGGFYFLFSTGDFFVYDLITFKYDLMGSIF